MKSPSSPLDLAIRFEAEGIEYFLKAAEKISHPLGKRMFEALAQDEKRHIQRIRAIKKGLEENDAWSDDTSASKEESLENIFEVARKEIDKEIKPDENDLEVISQALELENRGNAFYTDLAKKESDPKAKKFYELLAAEEKVHLKLLENTKEYLKSPEEWFCEEERSIFEG